MAINKGMGFIQVDVIWAGRKSRLMSMIEEHPHFRPFGWVGDKRCRTIAVDHIAQWHSLIECFNGSNFYLMLDPLSPIPGPRTPAPGQVEGFDRVIEYGVIDLKTADGQCIVTNETIGEIVHNIIEATNRYM